MVDIVVGLQYGDEGKGKIVNHLASQKKYDLCIRYNGGANAGHTVYKNNIKIVTHQIPTGIIHGIPSVIADNCYVNLDKLKKEINELKEARVNLNEKLFISNKCHLITDKHTELEINENKIGTTKSGIGPCAIDKYGRKGIKLTKQILIDNNLEFINIINLYDILSVFGGKKLNILIEGAQGFGLDINHGDYPYVTSSHCISTDCFNIGIPIYQYLKIDKNSNTIYGVAKIYETYVGAKEFQPKDDETLILIQKQGKEFGATTERKRQCNYLDLSYLIKSIWINQIDKLIINKCDIIEEINVFCLFHNDNMLNFSKFEYMKEYIMDHILKNIFWMSKNDIIFSFSPNEI